MATQLKQMLRSPIRLLFCLSTAVFGAAVADPLVEGASNAGWFGPGRFTDGSMADVLPVLLLGFFALGIHVAFRAYALERGRTTSRLLRLSEEALSGGVVRLLPLSFALQIVVLFAMETAEEYVVWHHGFGGLVWLGGPIAVSLCSHFAACVAVAFSLRAAIRTLATTAVRIIRIVRSSALRLARAEAALSVRGLEYAIAYRPAFASLSLGQRGPPAPLINANFAVLGEILCSLVQQFASPLPLLPARLPSS